MFKFDPSQALVHQNLSTNPETSVYPYKDDQAKFNSIVKCIPVKDPHKMSSILQNILIASTANSACLVPIQGHDVQKHQQGHSKIYLKMPRFQNSLMKVIQQYKGVKEGLIPKEKITHYFHGIASALDMLAMKDISHRNLKPTNILIDEEDHVYLSDLAPVQPPHTETTHGGQARSDNGSQYVAPECYFPDWPRDAEDIHKADVWALGMMMAEACLLDKFVLPSFELPMEEIQEIIEGNLTEIGRRYGKDMSKILRELLRLEVRHRENFSTICRMLEQSFPHILGREPKEMVMDFKQSKHNMPKEIQLAEPLDEVQENPSLEILPSNRERYIRINDPDDGNSLIEWHTSSKVYKITGHQIVQKLSTIKERPRLVLISIAILIVGLILLHFLTRGPSRDEYLNRMKQFTERHCKYFNIIYTEERVLTIELPYIYDRISSDGQYNYDYLTDYAMTNFIVDFTTTLGSDYLDNYIIDLRFRSLTVTALTDSGLANFGNAVCQFKGLKRFTFTHLNGKMTNQGVQQFVSTIADCLTDLEGLTFEYPRNWEEPIGFGPDMASNLGYLLDKLDKLTGLYLDMNSLRVFDQGLQELWTVLSNQGKNLQSLAIRPTSTYTPPSEFATQTFNTWFLKGLDNLKELEYLGHASTLSDTGLNALADSISEKELSVIKVYTHQTSVSPESLHYFGRKLAQKKSTKQMVISYPGYFPSYVQESLQSRLKDVPSLEIAPRY